MSGEVYRCGHPLTESNSLEWMDRKRGQLRRKCKRCDYRRRGGYRRNDAYRARQRARWAAGQRQQVVQPHHHGTTTGYNYGCRCDDCRAAINTAHRVARLRAKARKLGIEVPRELTVVRSVQSLDARFGGDEPRIGDGYWDDPTGDAAVSA